jgi:hypothetical protein
MDDTRLPSIETKDPFISSRKFAFCRSGVATRASLAAVVVDT